MLKKTLEYLHQQVRRVWAWMLRKDTFIFLLFVGMSALIWWGRTMSSQREVELKIPVVYANIPEAVDIDSPLPDEIVLTLRDNGRTLRQIKHQRPTLTVQMESRFDQEEGNLTISADMLRPKLQDLLPGSTNKCLASYNQKGGENLATFDVVDRLL